jgi:hypothetical protein
MGIITKTQKGCCAVMITGLLGMFASFYVSNEYSMLTLGIGAITTLVGGGCAIFIRPCCQRSQRVERLLTETQEYVPPEPPAIAPTPLPPHALLTISQSPPSSSQDKQSKPLVSL